MDTYLIFREPDGRNNKFQLPIASTGTPILPRVGDMIRLVDCTVTVKSIVWDYSEWSHETSKITIYVYAQLI
jgi:hypothetical protein